ncbi:RNA helicase [Cyathus striatus]|nr:RNA helicase [Cyathus striatus]
MAKKPRGNCPELLSKGHCPDPLCQYNHSVQVCEPCGFVAPSNAMFKAHLKGKKHMIRIAGRTHSAYCPLCNRNVSGGNLGWNSHISSRAHKSAADAGGIAPNIAPQEAVSNEREKYCDICQFVVPSHVWANHTQSLRHTRRLQYAAYRSALDEAEKEKNGVVVDGCFDFEFVEPSAAVNGVSTVASIKSTHPLSKVILTEAKLVSKQGGRTITSGFSVLVEGSDRKVNSVRPLAVRVTYRGSFIGRYEDRLEIVFEDTQLKKTFIISRALKVVIGSKSDHEALRPVAPYVPRKRTTRQPETNVVEGVRPPSLNAIPYVGSLPLAIIPKTLEVIISGQASLSEKLKQVKRVSLPSVLDVETYGRHFKSLLWIEEYKMEHDLERYDITNAKLTKNATYFFLEVPGLAEKRPSVLVGDNILIQKHGSTEGHWYSGGVHVVQRESVALRFAPAFARGWTPDQLCHVRFKLNRIPVRRQHQAMDTAFTEHRILFPSYADLPSSSITTNGPVKVFNRLIASNPPQLRAVQTIVNLPPGSVPFVVFGPPGTGKTITIIETIRQLLVRNPKVKILACAPSNSAADLIALRLTENKILTSDELFRFYAPSRHKGQVPDQLVNYTYVKGESAPRQVQDDNKVLQGGHFSVPPMARMKSFRVIVTTCVSASVVSGIGMPRGHFSHIIIDEAGQATEPEAFISIKMMADTATNVVIAGDPKQLGPIIRSDIARQLGLETSYLERLMNQTLYNPRDASNRGLTVVKLVKNFRSHSAILKFPNEQFYQGDLEVCAHPRVTDTYLNSSFLPSKRFPVVFHAVHGKDLREASSPSFFNIDEILQVKQYVKQLREDRQFRTSDSDIGIIAPYHAQCLKIRTALRGVADEVKVGSVEEFQGQERKVIIISTVRSSKEFVEYDVRHTLGFVANPRRFNVAITRAQALLIIVGDPQVLALDPLWRSFLNYIHLTMAPVDDDARGYAQEIRETAQLDMNDFARRMEELTLDGIDEEDDGNVDRPWRM